MKASVLIAVLSGGLAVPDAPALTAPANAAVLDDTTPEFSWQAVPGAVTYDIEIRATLTGTPTATGITGTTYTPSALDALLTYSWRVRAVNAVGAGAWSAARTFSYSLAAVETQIGAILAYRHTETSGTTAVNAGSAGTACNATISGAVTLGQTGKLGTNQAHDFTGTDGLYSVPSSSAWQNITDYTFIFVLKADTAGGSNAARLYVSGTMSCQFSGGLAAFSAGHPCATSPATTITTNGIDTNWNVLFVTFTGSSSKQIRLYKAVAGVVSELSYAPSYPVAGVGALSALTGNLALFNLAAGTRGMDGLVDETKLVGKVLSLPEMTKYASFFV